MFSERETASSIFAKTQFHLQNPIRNKLRQHFSRPQIQELLSALLVSIDHRRLATSPTSPWPQRNLY
nr:hypothetical protein [uncultured bacterium]